MEGVGQVWKGRRVEGGKVRRVSALTRPNFVLIMLAHHGIVEVLLSTTCDQLLLVRVVEVVEVVGIVGVVEVVVVEGF